MFENILKFFKKGQKENKVPTDSKSAAKERLHLVLMQDRANVSADFLDLMKQEIIEVIKKYIDVDEGAIDVRLTNKENEDGTNGAPALYANIPILNIKNEARKVDSKKEKKDIETKTTEDVKETPNNEEEVKETESKPVEEKMEENKDSEEVIENKEENKEEQIQEETDSEAKEVNTTENN